MTAVNINNMQGFGVLNNQINTTFNGNNFTKRIFYLFVDSEMLINRDFAFVKFNNFNFFRCDGADIGFYFFENPRIIYMDIIKRFVEQIAQNGRGTVNFTQDSLGAFAPASLAMQISHLAVRLRISASRSATFLFSATVRMMTPKFFGLMLVISRLSRLRSSTLLIFCETDNLDENGTSTR